MAHRDASKLPFPVGSHALAEGTILWMVLFSCTPNRSVAQALPDSSRFRPETHVLLADGPLATLPPPEVRRWQVGLLRADRIQHASVSFTLAVGFGVLTQRRASAVGACLGLGLLKECWDARRGRFDGVDLAADAAGALLGGWTAASP